MAMREELMEALDAIETGMCRMSKEVLSMDEYINKIALNKALSVAAANGKDKDRRTWVKAICLLHDMPAADVASVVHGRWIEDHDYLKCAECGVMVKWDFTFFDIGNWNFCPNCGAKMDGGED